MNGYALLFMNTCICRHIMRLLHVHMVFMNKKVQYMCTCIYVHLSVCACVRVRMSKCKYLRLYARMYT